MGMYRAVTERRGLDDRFSVPNECVGFELYDPLGKKIGRVEEMFVNAQEEPEYLRARIGVFGVKSVLLPIEMLVVNETQRTVTLG